MTWRIEIHIEEIVLHGFSPHARARIGDSVEVALAEHLAGAGALAATSDVARDRVDAGAIAVPSGAAPSAIGGAIAAAVAAAVGGVR
jgi:hypothetical protein